MKIRPAVLSDIPQLKQLRQELWPDTIESHEKELMDFFEDKSHNMVEILLAADKQRTILGFVELNVRSHAEGSVAANVPYLEGWLVTKNYRGKGIGSSLIKSAEKWALERGYKEIASDADISNVGSIRAHKTLGFTEVGRNVMFLKNLYTK